MHGISSHVGRPTNLGPTAPDHPHIKHVSAEMSLRYGRLFDETVRADYERALTQAKAQLGPVLPSRTQLSITEISG